MKHQSAFSLVGLNPKEELVYRALVDRGPSYIAEIALETKLYRQEIYRMIPSLVSLGFVRETIKGKRRFYTAESPDVLLRVYKERQAELEGELSELKSRFGVKSKKPIVTYREGLKSIKDAYSDIVYSLPRGGMYYRYSSKGALQNEKHKKYTPADYVAVRDQKQLERLVITNAKEKSFKRNLLGRDIRVVPTDFDLFEDNIAEIIYGNKVTIVDYDSETAITIDHPTIARFQEKIFRLLFRYLK